MIQPYLLLVNMVKKSFQQPKLHTNYKCVKSETVIFQLETLYDY